MSSAEHAEIVDPILPDDLHGLAYLVWVRLITHWQAEASRKEQENDSIGE